MSFDQFRRQTPTAPNDVSPVYYHLYDDIENDTSLTPGLRSVVFCAAYTIYSLEKKDSVLSELSKGKNRQDAEIKKCFDKYISYPGKRSSVIRSARQIADIYKDELTSFAFRPIANQISAINSSQSQIEVLINSHDDLLNDAVNKVDLSIEDREKLSMRGFAIHFVYAIATGVVAALMALSFSSPPVIEFAKGVLGHLNPFH